MKTISPTRLLSTVLIVAPSVCAHRAAGEPPEKTEASVELTEAPAANEGTDRLEYVRPVNYTHINLIGADAQAIDTFFWAEHFTQAYAVGGCMHASLEQVWDRPSETDGETDEDGGSLDDLPAMPETLDYRVAVLERWNMSVIERSRLTDLGGRRQSDLRSVARWDLGAGWDIGAAGEERPLHNEESYFAISAETQVRVAPQAELRFGYDVLRKGVPGVLDELDVSNEGMFLKFQWRF